MVVGAPSHRCPGQVYRMDQGGPGTRPSIYCVQQPVSYFALDQGIRLTQEEIDALLKRVEANALLKGDYEIIKSMTEAIMTLGQALDNKAASIKRLLAMLFGPKTEKKDNVLKENEFEQTDEDSKETEPGKKDKNLPKAKPEKKKKGHGKIPASNHTEADQKFISHEKFKQKDSCPLCLTGKLYPIKKQGIAIYLKGQPPIDATIYNLEKLRCNMCGEVFTAAVPDGITGKHYDETAMKILDLIQENKTRDKDERTGIFTSGIISILEDGKRIAIFYTGRNHAGENIASIYEMRDGEKDPPIQMCDSLSRNMSSEFKIILCHCITHARRGFVDVISSFPEECRQVIEILAKVYHVDAQAKEQNMTADQRLAFHQVHSGPQMSALRSWLDTQIKDKLVNPIPGLGMRSPI
jgi:transposase